MSSIYTRTDEVVDWRACIAPDGDNHEVSGGHTSLAVNPEVYRLLSVILEARVDARGADRPAATAIASAGAQ